MGLSPRGRGNRPGAASRPPMVGSIPAWAGEPRSRQTSAFVSRVYPRVGGGTMEALHKWRAGEGLSPRGRGNRERGRREYRPGGSIPAWAGEPRRRWRRRSADRVYPRVGGGTERRRGDRRADEGLSPRGRGNRNADDRNRVDMGSIPAWAGEPRLHEIVVREPRVYPRVGGGTRDRADEALDERGLSPRGRGNRSLAQVVPSVRGSIPAWAGEPIPNSCPCGEIRVYPRVGGGTRGGRESLYGDQGLSPRGRGNRDDTDLTQRNRGSIPAWAGEP